MIMRHSRTVIRLYKKVQPTLLTITIQTIPTVHALEDFMVTSGMFLIGPLGIYSGTLLIILIGGTIIHGIIPILIITGGVIIIIGTPLGGITVILPLTPIMVPVIENLREILTLKLYHQFLILNLQQLLRKK